ncbi:hypothetical protein ccbrp13_04500 [Ktedonobacteria bacterium brp13]|nr:hypothetical protein ccbrp13_04500 [Ktedonobacteria bacterium brp13]
MELPADIEQSEAFFIALLGDTSAGKTHYLASLIGYLQNEIGPRLHFSLHPLGEYSTRRWQKRYEPLLNSRHLLESTPTAEEDVQSSYPLSFQLSLDTGISKKNMTLGFFDASGSDVHNQRAILKRYIQNANGVLYFIDPLTIQTISQQIRPASHASASTRDTTREIVQMPRMLRGLFEQEQIITPQEKVKVPTAFVLSKLDTLLPLLYPGCPLLRPNIQQETIAEERLQSINTEVSSLLGAWLGPQFGQLVRSEFTNYGYFSVSALGSNPAPNEHTVPSLSPLHIEDPLLWLFAQLQVLKTA